MLWKNLRKGCIGSSTFPVFASNLQPLCLKDFLSQKWSFHLRALDGLLFSIMNFIPFLNFCNLLASTAPCSNKLCCLSMYCRKKSLILFVLNVWHASWCALGHLVTFSKSAGPDCQRYWWEWFPSDGRNLMMEVSSLGHWWLLLGKLPYKLYSNFSQISSNCLLKKIAD